MPEDSKPDSMLALYVGLAIQAAGIVWWASNLNSQVQHNDFQIQMMGRDVEKNSKFVELWPAGRWGSGSLPDDVRQNMMLESLEKRGEKLPEDLYKSRIISE